MDCSTRMTAVPLIVDALDDAQQALDHGGGEPQGELVDDQQLRFGDEGHGETEHLLLASRERACRGVPAAGQHGEVVEDRLGGPGQVLVIGVVEPTGHPQALGHG